MKSKIQTYREEEITIQNLINLVYNLQHDDAFVKSVKIWLKRELK